jgi:serine/threonine-protein kinase
MATALPELQTLLGDRYQLDREIGRGGMATVYLATDTHTDKPVAVKVLHADLGMALGPERFRREIDVASHLSHPNILAIEAFGGSGEFLWYVMPFVQGESLADRLRKEGMLSLEEAVRITCQVARALDHAHRQGVIHRDIKPDNILLDGGEALLADFGIARAISESGDERLTKTGLTLGTPTYMSPEQAVAERNLDGRSDIYSLGCVLYEMLAGSPPFVGPSMQVIIARHTLDTVPSLTVARETVPDEVEDAVLRSLAKLPADRFATAGDFADALEASLKSGGSTLGQAERRRQPRRGPMETRATLAAAAAAEAIAAPKRRRRRLAIAGGAVAMVLALAGVAWRLWAPGAAGAAGDASGLSPKRIAVLYFEDLSPDRSLAALGDGLTEELIGTLGAVQGLDVVSRNGVAQFRDPDLAVDSVAQALGAGTVVRGSVETRGDAVRVTVRLVDGASGADYKRTSFDVPAARALAARDSLVDQVSRFLRARVGDEVRLRETRAATTNSHAWGLALQAEKLLKSAEALDRGNDSTGASRARLRADSLFARAVATDARWSTPLVGRGRVALALAQGTKAEVEAATAMRRARELAQQALQLDPNSADALVLRGTARLEQWTRHLEPDPKAAATLLAEAEADLKRATGLAPGNALAWSNLARVYYQKPNLIEATLATRRAYEADAYLANADALLWRLYVTAYDTESFLDAKQWCDEGRRRFPENPQFVRCQLWLFTTSARDPDAAAAWQLVDTLKARTPAKEWPYLGREAQMLAAAAIGRAGMKDSAGRVLERARAGPDVDPDRELLTAEAFIRDLLGQRDEALDLLKQYLIARPEHRKGFAVSQSWWWRGLRADPRFKELVGTGE